MVQMYLLNTSTTHMFVFVLGHDSWVVRDDLLTVVCHLLLGDGLGVVVC